VLSVVSLIFAAGIFTGILSGTGMVEAMSRSLLAVIPDALGPYLAGITALVSLPFTFFMSNDAFYFGVLPILSEAAQGYGITPVEMARASLIGQPVHLLSPLVPSTYLLVGLAGVEFGDHQRYSLKWATMVCLVMLAAALAFGFGTAHAGASPELTLVPPAVERCLSPAVADRAQPVYPEERLRRKEAARVDVELSFDGPEAAPDVRFVGDIDRDYREAIEAYARQLRVPCMAKGGKAVTLEQHFDFVPNDGRKVAWTAPVEGPDARRAAALKCMVDDPKARPEYPAESVRANREGVVVARLRFTAADRAPEVEILDNGNDGRFANAVRPYAATWRMPCLQGEPVEVMFHYTFRIDGNGRRVLNDLDLRSFIAGVKKVPAGSAYFDTQTMGCPFDVRLTFLQPWEANRVEELEQDVPARHAFLDWMSQRQFDMPARATNAFLGQQMVVHIPCAIVDL